MDSPQFQASYRKLNPEQKLAVDTIEGPVMVVAGPGTGKTQILTLRIANILLRTQVNPENILALTFTENAAREMRERLVNMIGTPGYRVEINTFHSFCNDVIKNYPEDFPELLNSQSITDVEQIQLLEEILDSLQLTLLKPFGDPLYYLRPAISEINNLKKEGVTPEKLKEALQKQKENFEKIEDLYHDKGKYKGEMKGKYQDLKRDIEKNEELVIIYDAYQKALRTKHFYDFNDMLLEVKNALEKNRDLRLRLQEKYHYILVDEHQDTNSSQNKIVELLGDFFESPNIFVVGDEKQAIFRFQGASLENFLFFRTLYPDVKLISLVENYRSHQKILDAADSLISKNYFTNLIFERKFALHANSKVKEGPIKVLEFNDYFAESEYIGEDISKKIESGVNASEIAVIARNNRDLEDIANILERRGVKYTIAADANILQDPYIQKLIILLRAIQNVGSEIETLKAMHLDLFDIDPLDIYKILSSSRSENKSILDLLSDPKTLKSLKLNSLKEITSFNEKLVKLQKQNHNESFENLFVATLTDTGLKNHILKSSKRYEVLDKLISLFEETRTFVYRNPEFKLIDFLNYLDACEKHNVPLKTKVQTLYTDAVNLMTAHRSKGLEFEYVYIINCFDGHWGNSKKRGSNFKIPWETLGIKLSEASEENEDERRLFFVALTRAKNDINLTFSNHSIEGREQVATQFIGEIKEELIERINIEEFEKEFLQNKDIVLTPKNTSDISPKQKQFFQKLFLERGLSATAIDNYLRCPWTYFYRNLLLFPGVRSNQEIFGSAIHFALDQYLKKSSKEQVSSKDLMGWFNEVINKTALSKSDKELMIKKGEVVLKDYPEKVLGSFVGKSFSETVIRGVKLSDGVIINGRIDMIETTDRDDQIIVHDFKTGKIKSRNAISGLTASTDVNYLRQLTFYKLLIEKYREGKTKVLGGVIDFVEPDAKGNYKSEYFDITDEEVRSLENQVLFIAGEIMNLEFWDRYCDDKECEYCSFRKLTF